MAVPHRPALHRAPLPEPFLVSRYRITAPWRACAHACAYCDGRAEKYYVDGDFGRDIVARPELPGRLQADLAAGRAGGWYGAACLGSGVTDVYQPEEAEAGLTGRMVRAWTATGQALVILTKSALVARDYDALARLPGALVIFTLTTLDPARAAVLEPGASSPAERLEALSQARAQGLAAGVMAMPLCPGITDAVGEVRALASAAREAGASFLWPGGLTLRPGRQKDHFLEVLDQQWPELGPAYRRWYGEDRPSGAPSRLDPEFHRDWRSQGLPLPIRIPWSVYRPLLSLADSLWVLLCHLDGLWEAPAERRRALARAREAYGTWLRAAQDALPRERRGAARQANLFETPGFPRSEAVDRALREADLEAILGHKALARRLEPLIRGEAGFPYPGESLPGES